MTTVKELKSKLYKNNIPASYGDSDESSLIVWDVDRDKIEEALKGLKYSLSICYGQGIIIFPEK